MSSNNNEVIIQKLVLQQFMIYGQQREFPVSILYKNEVDLATISLKSENPGPHYSMDSKQKERNIATRYYAPQLNPGNAPDLFLSLQITATRRGQLSNHFKLEIEDMHKNVVFSFLGQWKIQIMNKIVNLSLLRRQHLNLFINNGRDLTVVISLGPLNQLNNPKVETKVETKFIPDVAPMESLKAMLDKGILTDVVIKTEEEQLHCHKVVLAASSEVFRAMFETDMKESQQNVVDLREVYDARTIRDVIHYLYTKQTPPNIEQTAQTLLVAADYFQLAALKDLCVVILLEVIAVDTAAEILQLAEKYNADVLKTKAVNFILDNYHTVMVTPGWKSIPDQMTKSLISTIVNIAGSKKIND